MVAGVAAMRLVITDVTEMHRGNYCVAGWDAVASRMVRPLPNGQNWTATLLTQHHIAPGAIVRVDASVVQPNSVYPHRTEDTPIVSATIATVSAGPGQWSGPQSPPAAGTLSGAFQNHLQTTGHWNGALKAYVAEGTQIGSLAAVSIQSGELEFFEDDYQGNLSLRAFLTDSQTRYNLPVVAKGLRESYRVNGVETLNQALPLGSAMHVRVGLARAWSGQAGRCYVMVNGVYW
jgi:hypothetical protein